MVFGLILALVATGALVTVALGRTQPQVAAGATPPPGASAAPVAAPGASPAPAGSTAPPAAVPANRYLSALNDQVAWRSYGGSCPANPTGVESTTNRGANWRGFDVATGTQSAGVLRLEASGPDLTYLITQRVTANCAPQYVGTYTAGAAFEAYPARTATTWFLLPSDRATVQTPKGPAPSPCRAVAIATRSETEAALLCADATVRRTKDAGATWDAGLSVPGAAALDDTPGGYVIGVAGQPGCAGVQLRTIGKAATAGEGATVGCFKAQFQPGDVAVSAGGTAIWVWAGASLGVSLDGGASW